MTDRYLFKAKRKMGEDWIEGYIYRFSEDEQPFIMVKNSFGEGCEVDETTICQFTGLYDGTKWEDLTKEERQAFYEEVCLEDEKSIKYQNVEDVKHLWKGEKIWENDIIHNGDENILYIVEWHDTGFMGKAIKANNRIGLSYWKDKIQKIGNTFDNPELLGG